MDVRITPAQLDGVIRAIPSKSDAHRLLISALLSNGPSEIGLERTSDDIEATIGCVEALGARVDRDQGRLTVTPGAGTLEDIAQLDCSESGSTLRFMLPVAAALHGRARFTGSGRLPDRPIGPLKVAMEAHGVAFLGDTLPFEIVGTLRPGRYVLPGNISSQYLTGLLLALSVVEGQSTIELSTPLESSAYVDMTVFTLRRFGARIEKRFGAYGIAGQPHLSSPGALAVEGDWSNACFFLGAGALAGRVTVTGLDIHSRQADRAIVEHLRRFGAAVEVRDAAVTVAPGELRGLEIDVSEAPDLMPALAAVAAFAQGETRFVNAARLRLKESDRIAAAGALIRALGGGATELPDGLIVHGGGLTGGKVDSFRDHRIAMAAAIAAIRCSEAVTVLGADAVNKSYPGFFDDYNAIGGKAHVL